MLRVAVVATLLAFSVQTASAQTSSELVLKDPRGQYPIVRDTLRQVFESVHKKKKPPKVFDLLSACTNAGQFIGRAYGKDPAVDAMADLAFDLAYWDVLLAEIGYPRMNYAEALANQETAELAILSERLDEAKAQGKPLGFKELTDGALARKDKFADRLVEELAQIRQSKRSLPAVVKIGRCDGSARVSVKVATNPRGARVLVIPTFYYELCKAQKIDPDDVGRCNRWSETPDGALSDVAGDFHYQARWSDGATRRGTLSFRRLRNNQTVVLQRPR